MALKVGGNGQPKPFYVNECKVVSVTAAYDQPSPFNSDIINDIALEIKYDKGDGTVFTFNIRGSFKHDPLAQNTVTDWGSAFKVRRFFEALGITGDLNEDNTIPDEWLTDAIGRTFFKLDYVSGTKDDGKYKYSSWDVTGRNPDKLIAEFMDTYNRGYAKNYSPELLEATGFPFGDNTNTNPIF